MFDFWLPIILVFLVVAIVFRFFKPLLKLVIILALVTLGIIAYYNISNGALSFKTITSKVESHLVNQTSQEVLNNVVQKLKGMNSEQVESYLKSSQLELSKYGITAETVRNELAKSK